MTSEAIWIAAIVGAFVLGGLIGAFLAGVGVSRLLDVLLDGLSLELGEEIERRFKIELINRELAEQAFARVPEPLTDSLDKEIANAPRI